MSNDVDDTRMQSVKNDFLLKSRDFDRFLLLIPSSSMFMRLANC